MKQSKVNKALDKLLGKDRLEPSPLKCPDDNKKDCFKCALHKYDFGSGEVGCALDN